MLVFCGWVVRVGGVCLCGGCLSGAWWLAWLEHARAREREGEKSALRTPPAAGAPAQKQKPPARSARTQTHQHLPAQRLPPSVGAIVNQSVSLALFISMYWMSACSSCLCLCV